MDILILHLYEAIFLLTQNSKKFITLLASHTDYLSFYKHLLTNLYDSVLCLLKPMLYKMQKDLKSMLLLMLDPHFKSFNYSVLPIKSKLNYFHNIFCFYDLIF
jgi:hypothetical protein